MNAKKAKKLRKAIGFDPAESRDYKGRLCEVYGKSTESLGDRKLYQEAKQQSK